MSLFGPPNIKKLKKKGKVDGLIKALGYKRDWQVREAAARALGEIGDPRAVEPLLTALEDEERAVFAAAAEALGKIGDQRAVEPLIRYLQLGRRKDDRRMVVAATSALGRIGDPRAIEWLIPDIIGWEDVRNATVQALARIGEPAVGSLIAVLGDRNKRILAEEALVRVGKPAVGQLVNALVEWRFPKTVAGILERLRWQPRSDKARASYCAVKGEWDACVEIGAPAVEPLIAALASESWDVRKAAAKVLITIYKSGQLDDAQKRSLLAQRSAIVKKHADRIKQHECGAEHTDTGIGTKFPI